MSPSTHSTSGASAASTGSTSPRPNAPYSSWTCSRLDTCRTLSPRCRDVVLPARQFGDRLDRDEQAVGQPDVGRGGSGRRRIGHVAGVNLVEPGEVLDIG